MTDSLGQKQSFGSTVAGYAAFPAITQGGSAMTAIARQKGNIKKAIAAQNHQGFKNLAGNLKSDTFTKKLANNLQIANEYDAYKSIVKDNAKLSKKLAKATKKGKDVTELSKQAKKASDTLKEADKALSNGKSVIEATSAKAAKEAAEEAAKKAGKTAKEISEAGAKAFKNASEVSVKGVIKQEAKSVMNVGFAALFTFLPTFINNAIPAFKNDGFKAGLKETAKALGFAGADLGLSAVATAIGGAIGGAIGSVFCPGVGTGVGRTVGAGIASAVVSTKVANAAEKAGKYTGQKLKEEEQQQLAQNKQLDMNF